MLEEDDILTKLDNYRLGYYCQFINLGDVNSYLIDCRLNVFKGDNDRWAIVGERLGFNRGLAEFCSTLFISEIVWQILKIITGKK